MCVRVCVCEKIKWNAENMCYIYISLRFSLVRFVSVQWNFRHSIGPTSYGKRKAKHGNDVLALAIIIISITIVVVAVVVVDIVIVGKIICTSYILHRLSHL